MTQPFLAEITMFGLNFPPVGWQFCNGQLLSISQYSALFSLIGTYYGGNGQSTFALPNLQGMAVVAWGNGTGLSSYSIGESTGSPSVALNYNQQPSHSHGFLATTDTGTVATAAGNQLAQAHNGSKTVSNNCNYLSTNAPNVVLASGAIANSGASSPAAHNNMQPYLVLNFCIAITGGIYPSRG